MDLIPKFKIGQRVFCVRVGWGSKEIQCPDCLGTKEWEVRLPSGEIFKHDCQTCRTGYFSKGTVSEWADHLTITDYYTVGSIQTDTNSETPIRYMCRETGVGSGSVYNEEQLHPDEQSAQAYGEAELARVKGLRQQEELTRRASKKKNSLIHGKRKPKSEEPAK